jgi:hypothetical protein
MHRLLSLLALPCAAAVVACIGLYLPVTGLLFLLTAAWWAWWWAAPGWRPTRRHARSAVQLLLLWAVGAPNTLLELGRSMNTLQLQIDRHGAGSLQDHQLFGIYALQLGLGAAGHTLGLHEVAWEAWGLARPGEAERRWPSDFALRDPKVRRAIAGWRTAPPGPLPPAEVAWTSYFGPGVSPSVSLALNCPLSLTGTKAEDGTIEVAASCLVAYPQHARLPLTTVLGEAVGIEEGVFWALQERGWLHPYTAVWTFSVQSDDPRLGEVERAQLGRREELLVGAVGR